MLPVLTSTVLTYNNKFREQQETILLQVHDLCNKIIFALQFKGPTRTTAVTPSASTGEAELMGDFAPEYSLQGAAERCH